MSSQLLQENAVANHPGECVSYHWIPGEEISAFLSTSPPQEAVESNEGTLLTHIEPAVNQHPQVPFCRAALQPLLSQSVLVPRMTLSQVQNLAFGLVKFHPINDFPIPLQGILSLKGVISTSQFGISKLANGAFNSCIQFVDKYIEQNWP
ncbi:hypothetical protein QYF61_017839 [Mycteria americana]|uniref:Uncharacterized protein n=1 Tax=Mycteria americana TaxID=33587 RepID=A0AAN7NN42_MYCAM|nr:hypothetical protein QYF61_017839 [Mycteria americana]